MSQIGCKSFYLLMMLYFMSNLTTLTKPCFYLIFSNKYFNVRLIAHGSNTNFMLVTPRLPPTAKCWLIVNLLEWVSLIKFFGLLLDTKLNFGLYIDQGSQNLSKEQGIIYSINLFSHRCSAIIPLFHCVSHLIHSIVIREQAPESKMYPVWDILNKKNV